MDEEMSEEMAALHEMFDGEDDVDFAADIDPHLVARLVYDHCAGGSGPHLDERFLLALRPVLALPDRQARVPGYRAALEAMPRQSYCGLRLLFAFLRRVHDNASINGMTAADLQQSLYRALLPPSKGDYKEVIGDLIVLADQVFVSEARGQTQTLADTYTW
jgi:hypothetical protein